MQYGADYGGEIGAEEANSAWVELRCVEAGRGGDGGGDGICSMALDSCKELVWVGTNSGMLHAHIAVDLQRVVSVQVSGGGAMGATRDIRSIVTSASSVLCAVPAGLCVLSKGGVVRNTLYADAISQPRALALNPVSDGQICIGGASRTLAVVDWENGRILRQAALRGASGVTDATWSEPSSGSSVCIFGTQTGRISLCDPSTMREVNAAVAFAGSITSVSCNGFTLATTGCSPHGGVAYMEQTVKMFDIRQMNTPLPSIPFPAAPVCSAFDDWTNEVYCGGAGMALWALSPNGVLQCFDCSQPPEYFPLSPELHLDASQDSFTCMAVSKQGLLVLADSGGFIHEWSASEFAQVNPNSEPLFENTISKGPTSQPTSELSHRLNQLLVDDNNPVKIPRFIPPVEKQTYLSDMVFKHLDKPDKKIQPRVEGFNPEPSYESAFARRPWGGVSPRLLESVINSVKKQGSVGYAQAPPGFRRNTTDGHKAFPSLERRRNIRRNWKANGKDGAENQHRRFQPNDDSGDENNPETSSIASCVLTPTGRSKYIEMDLVAAESLEGFDFLKYNPSGLFCGLENTLSNIYVNAAVQALYFTPPLRHAMLKHTCNREECIACELGFLFHMIDLGGPGMACEAGNFTKAFSKMANAEALGLLDGKLSLPPSQRIENFTRYLLEQLHQDLKDDESLSAVSLLLGGDCLSTGKYSASGNLWERWSRPFQHTLEYESKKPCDSFCELLEHSLHRDLDPTRAFCEVSGTYEMMSSHRKLITLPNMMLLGSNTKDKKAIEWWGADGISNGINVDLMRCPSREEELGGVAETVMGKRKRLLESFKVDIDDDGVHVADISDENESLFGFNNSSNRQDESIGATNTAVESEHSGDISAKYDLAFVIAFVPPTHGEATAMTTNVRGHLVAYIKVPEAYKEWKRASGVDMVTKGPSVESSGWYCFNDFVIAPCSGFEEVAAFDVRWKVPCLMAYVRRDISARMEVYGSKSEENKVNLRDVIGSERSNGAYGLFDDEETPEKGTMFALDCEFVMTGRDEAILYGDGTRRVVSPAKMALGRVSVIRASGPRKGLALIDDYVEVKETVVDYLTRFSGLTDGDLNATTSRFEVKPLKTVYRRLRSLVDVGCVFIGHGLKKDFRIINFVVPANQVIDTVTLFREGTRRRLLGLRFLTMALLEGEIQTHTHDSIEDADAALKLYDLYKELVGDGSEERMQLFRQLITSLYSYGYSKNFQADVNDPFKIETQVGSRRN